MPEGDTIFRAARRLNRALQGDEVTRFELRVPALAAADLRGEVVHEVIPRGKHLLHRIGDFTLRSHLRMDGSWHVYRAGERWRAPAYKARAIVSTAIAETVGFEVSMLALVPTRDEHELVGHLGPDPLAADWNLEEAARRLAADEREIHVALLDQRNVAGFGNEYAAELLFLRGILPTTPADSVDVTALLELGVRTIRANKDRSNRTFTGLDRPGQATWVYGRAHKPCRRCHTLIETGELGAKDTEERVLFWCPRCQN